MQKEYEITTGTYCVKIIKYLFQGLFAYLQRNDQKLERIYYEMMDLHMDYIEKYYEDEEKEEKLKESIEEIISIVSIVDGKDLLKVGDEEYIGLKLRENIIHDLYIELWLIEKELYLYIFKGKERKEEIIPFCINDPYLIRLDQVYEALREKRIPGLLSFVSEKG
ncbi:hypothetical protein [Inediibacterium massiliense]|uniref:hypothetical protein n=1 Tax=Inediibacterium massiliense TaxID=1658111 RepID=UPI0006B53335|nr:hypothetical protein [Inediibacterium massiliense]